MTLRYSLFREWSVIQSVEGLLHPKPKLHADFNIQLETLKRSKSPGGVCQLVLLLTCSMEGWGCRTGGLTVILSRILVTVPTWGGRLYNGFLKNKNTCFFPCLGVLVPRPESANFSSWEKNACEQIWKTLNFCVTWNISVMPCPLAAEVSKCVNPCSSAHSRASSSSTSRLERRTFSVSSLVVNILILFSLWGELLQKPCHKMWIHR